MAEFKDLFDVAINIANGTMWNARRDNAGDENNQNMLTPGDDKNSISDLFAAVVEQTSDVQKMVVDIFNGDGRIMDKLAMVGEFVKQRLPADTLNELKLDVHDITDGSISAKLSTLRDAIEEVLDVT